jgi:N utilization substance protein A
VEDLSASPLEELVSINGFDEGIATELIARAKDFLQRKKEECSKKVKSMKIDPKVIALGVLSDEMLLSLAEQNVLTIDDLADLSSDELIDILPMLHSDLANEIILKARAHWFD